MFTRAESLVHAPPHLLFLARAHEKLGELVKAREAYLKIVKEQLPATAPRAFHDARAAADSELRSIEPRIANLTIRVQAPPEATDVRVLVDGAPLPAVLVGVARPVDPGEHRIEAVATGFRAKNESVKLLDGERRTVTLALIADPTATPPGTAPAGEEPAATPGAVLPPQRATGPVAVTSSSTEESGGGLRIGSYVALGVGAVGLGLGTYFLLDSRSKRADADAAYDECEANGDCRENDASARRTATLDDDARTSMTLSIVGYSLGAVGVGVGTALLLVSSGGTEEQQPSGLTVKPYLGFGNAGVFGSF